MSKNCQLGDINTKLTASRPNDLGFYHSCISNTSQSYFLLSRAKPNPLQNISDLDPRDLFELQELLSLGVCAESSCSQESIGRLYGDFFEILPEKQRDYENLTTTDLNAYNKEFRVAAVDPLVVFAVLAFGILVIMSICSTCKNWAKKSPKTKKKGPKDSKKPLKDKKRQPPSLYDIFDLTKNTKSVISPPTRRDPITQVFTISRALAMPMVVIGHEITERIHQADPFVSHPVKTVEYLRTSQGVGVIQMALYAVSIFFFMGGFVTVIAGQSFIRKAKAAGRGNWAIYLYMVVRRWARVFPVLFLTEVFVWKAGKHLSGSPTAFLNILVNDEKCQFGNVFNEMTLLMPSEGCANWVWYLQCDFNCFLILVWGLFGGSYKKKFRFVLGWVVFSFVSSAAAMYGGWRFIGMLSNDLIYVFFFYRFRVHGAGALLALWLTRNRDRRGSSSKGKDDLDKKKVEQKGLDQEKKDGGKEREGENVKEEIREFEAKDRKKKDQDPNGDTDQSLEGDQNREGERRGRARERIPLRRRSNKIGPYGPLSLAAGLLTLTITTIVYNIGFQTPHLKVLAPIPLEISFFLFSAFIIILGFFATIYGILNLNKHLNAVLINSPIINGLANISFSGYLIHACVIFATKSLTPRHYGYSIYDILGFFSMDFVYTVVIAFVLTVVVEVPLNAVWKKYVDGRFLNA